MNEFFPVEVRKNSKGRYIAFVVKRDQKAPERYIVASGYDWMYPNNPSWASGTYFNDILEAVKYFKKVSK